MWVAWPFKRSLHLISSTTALHKSKHPAPFPEPDPSCGRQLPAAWAGGEGGPAAQLQPMPQTSAGRPCYGAGSFTGMVQKLRRRTRGCKRKFVQQAFKQLAGWWCCSPQYLSHPGAGLPVQPTSSWTKALIIGFLGATVSMQKSWAINQVT